MPRDMLEKMKVAGLVYKLMAGSSRHTLKERGIFGKTIPLAVEQAKNHGFKYMFSYCGIIQTKKICLRTGFKVVAEGDLKSF